MYIKLKLWNFILYHYR